jgi:hypothetical protein
MRRRHIIAGLLLSLVQPTATEAQQAAKTARIGYLGGVVDNKPNHDAFLQGLRDLGYVEGRNFVMGIPLCRAKVRATPSSCDRTGCAQG